MHLTRNTKERCVMARIMRRAQMHQKNFSLGQYGSWEAAENAAKKWRDEQLQILPPSVMNAKDRMTVRNHSGVVGVHLAPHRIRKKNGREYEYWRWVARWPGCRNSGGVAWSIRTLGDDDAFALAVLSRKMEEVNRYVVMTALEKIYGDKEHLAIMELKQQEI